MNFKSSKIRWVIALSFALVITLAIIFTTTSIRGIARADSSASGPTIASDQADYAPGSNVTLTGAGWSSGEKVHIYVNDSVGNTWSLDSNPDPVADDNGGFTYSFSLPSSFIASYTVTATGPTSGTATTTFTDAGPAGNLDQCANLGTVCDTNHSSQWQNGNLNANQAIYFEGDSVPYRAQYTGLTSGQYYQVTIQWDTTQSGKHALDYLTSYNRTVTTADPCAGLTCGTPTNTLTIPPDPNVTGAGLTPVSGNFTLLGGTFTSTPHPFTKPPSTGNICATYPCTINSNPSAYTLSGTFSGNSQTSISLLFQANAQTVVLAWGGHISTRADWGANNSAVAISGSPYHMRLLDLTCSDVSNCSQGNQDRGLDSAAVIFPGSITIIKHASPQGATSFPFTASPSPLTNFSLVDDGSSASTKTFSNITNFQTYTVTEDTPANWTLTGVVCTVTSPNGGTQTVSGATTTINLKEGENVTCTYSNSHDTGSLKISKTLDDGGSGFSGTFTIHYDCGGGLAGDVSVAAGGSATVNSIPTGSSCAVSEPNQPTPPTGYSWGTPVITGSPATIVKNTTAQVTVANVLTRDTSSLKITKAVDTGGSNFTSGTFNIHVDCGTGGTFDKTITYPTPGNVTITGIPTGSNCTVSEPTLPAAPTGYSWGIPTINGSPATIGKNTTVTVSVKNTLTLDTGSLTITKTVDAGGSNFTSGTFDVHVDCGTGGTFDKTISYPTPGNVTITGIPTGSSCAVSEPTLPAAPTGYSWDPPTITGSPAVITTKDVTFDVVVKNVLTRDTGSLTITKTLDTGGSNFDKTTQFTIHYDCGNGLSGDVNVVGGGSATIKDIPTGSSCTVTEPTQPTAPTSYSWSTPVITGSPAAITTKGDIVTVDVKNVLTRDIGSLQILKTLSNPDGAAVSNSFTIHYDCGGGLSGDKTVTAGDKTGQTIPSIPTGSSCTVSETLPDAPIGYSWSVPVITGSPVAITTKGAIVEVTVANVLTRDRGSLQILKTLSNLDNATVDTSYTIHYGCGGSLSGDVTVTAGDKTGQTVSGIPTGSECTVSEQLPDAPTGFSWGTPAFDPSAKVTIDTKGATVTVTVANTITRDRGSLKISKTLDDGGSNFDPATKFTIHYDCGNGLSGDVNVIGGGSETVNDIPTGSSCTVTEPTQPTAPTGYSWDPPTITGSPAAIDTKGAIVEVTVKNLLTRDTGSLKISKTLDDGGSGFKGTFTVHYDCGNSLSGDVSVVAGGSATVNNIPTGSSCTVTEPTQPTAPTGYSWSTPVIVGSPAAITTKGATVTVDVMNGLTRDSGSLKISKTLDDGGSGFKGTFNIHVDCGTGGVFDPTIDYPTPGNVTVPGIPTGSSCTVTEPTQPAAPTGYSWGTPTISGSPAPITTKGAIVEVTVKNVLTRDTGSLKISKTLSGGPKGFSGTFTIHYDCGNGLANNVSVVAGGSATVNNIPTGSSCTVTEPTLPTGYSWGPPVISGSPAAITTKGKTVVVTVKNRLPLNTGALTMGFWQNKNGQGIISGGASTSGVCNSGTWLRTYAPGPFQDLSATSSCSQVASYVLNIIKAANASGSSMNAMLKAQMLATALDVYFSDPALGGNKISAPAPIGGVKIDLTMICKIADSNGTGSCGSSYYDVSSAFGGAKSLTVSQILTYAASKSNADGSMWYGNVKATQEMAKNAFDAINNQVVYGP